MSKPTTEFNLDLRDIDHIENAINSVIARRSSAMSALTENAVENTMDISAYREIKQEVELRDYWVDFIIRKIGIDHKPKRVCKWVKSINL